jgi:hypothetical protein|tara:strand:- start:412 stop:684 length:273 start_codon:yes stop_codon:yes gene_type:complete
MTKQLVTFEIIEGEVEYTDHGIYDKKYSDDEIINHFWFGQIDNLKDFEDDQQKGLFWDGSRLICVYSKQDINETDAKILSRYGVAYEHHI